MRDTPVITCLIPPLYFLNTRIILIIREIANTTTEYCGVLFLKRFYLFIFRERGKEGEREGEKH